MSHFLLNTKDYKIWLKDIKSRIQQSQIKAAIRVNTEMLNMYWDLGEMIIKKQSESNWGDGLIDQLSKDLTSEFPQIKGFSYRNLFYIRKWVLFYSSYSSIDNSILPQLVAQIQSKVPQLVRLLQTNDKQELKLVQQVVALIPWGHNIKILTICKDIEEALFYVIETIKNNWSRAVLVLQMESGLYQRQGQAITNFEFTLPKPHSDLAKEIFKDSYHFDFIKLTPEAKERDIENALVDHITKFLLELGAGFAYMGKQFYLEIGGEEFYLDLLFYHTKIHSYIVIDLKITGFKPEYAGKMNFYLNAVDDLMKSPEDCPSIGIILCKSKNKIIAEYALKNIKTPIGIADYVHTKVLPRNLKNELPSVEEIQSKLEEKMSTISLIEDENENS